MLEQLWFKPTQGQFFLGTQMSQEQNETELENIFKGTFNEYTFTKALSLNTGKVYKTKGLWAQQTFSYEYRKAFRLIS